MVANIVIDDEEAFDKLCGKCQSNSDKVRCTGCGSEAMENSTENNPNFDESKFDNFKKVRG